jgi:hypothetical protein
VENPELPGNESSKAESKELLPLRRRGRPPGRYGEYHKVRIGADLEFEIFRKGVFYPANKALHGISSPVGVDGNSTTGELRPLIKTGGRPDSLFYWDETSRTAAESQGISLLLDDVARRFDESDEIGAGSGKKVPLGGHIHISGIAIDSVFINALDKFITTPLNEVSDIRLRKSKGYGRLSAVDTTKPHGGIEYRSPPSWLSTPEITKGVIAVTWVLAHAQRHGSITRIQTWDDFFENCRKGHAQNIKKFTVVLAELKQRNIKLEDIEVLKAWDKRHLLKDLNTPKKALPVEWARSDSFIPDIAERVGQLSSHIPFRFVGANQDRSRTKAIFLPEWWGGALPRFHGITSQEWNLPWVGLSWRLRQDVELAARVVTQIVCSVSAPTQ